MYSFIYFFLGVIYLIYLRKLFSKNKIIQVFLAFLAFPTLILGPFYITLTNKIFLTSKYVDEILEAFQSFNFHINWVIAIFSFLFFLKFVPNIWVFEYDKKIKELKGFSLKINFPFRACLIILGISFLINFSDLIFQIIGNSNDFVFDRNTASLEIKEKALKYGRGLFGFISSILVSSKYILIAHIVHVQKFKKVYSKFEFKLLVLLFLGSSLLVYLTRLGNTSSRIGMVLTPLIIFLQYKYIFSEFPIKFNQIKFNLKYTLFFVIIALMPPLFSFLAYFRTGRLAEKFNIFSSFIHGMSGLMTISEFAALFALRNNNQLNFEYGYSFFLDIFQFIPRFIYQTKPITSFSFRMSQEIYDLSFDNPSTWVHTFTPWGEGYLQFSFLGIIISSALLAFLAYVAVKFVNRYKIFTFNFLFSFLPTYLTTFRGDLSAAFGRFYDFIFFSILGYFLLVILIKFIPLKKIKSNNSPIYY